MPILPTDKLPKYRKHKASGQAIVTLCGQDHYLGPHGTKASRLEYDRLTAEWLTNGRQTAATGSDFTIVELLAAFRRWAVGHYRKDGKPTREIGNMDDAARPLKLFYGRERVRDFGPQKLKAIQALMMKGYTNAKGAHIKGLSRRVINNRIGRIKHIFKWAVSEEIAPPSIAHALATVAGLQFGRTEAREMPPVRPVDAATVESTLIHLPAVVADMVRFQRLTGCRPNEVCIIRPCDVALGDEVWSYRPASHKTEHHGRERIVFIGPKAQDVLRPYLLRDKQSFCFAPSESERKRNADRAALRQSPITPSQALRKPKRNRRRPAGDCYTASSYRRAIHRACEIAFPVPEDLPEDQRPAWRKSHQWHPNRLRHSAATLIRQQFGLEAAQVALGHASADVSQIYAERDFTLAVNVMQKIG